MSDLGSYKSNVNPKVQGLKDIIQNVQGETRDERTRETIKYIILARETGNYGEIAARLRSENWEKQRDARREIDINWEFKDI